MCPVAHTEVSTLTVGKGVEMKIVVFYMGGRKGAPVKALWGILMPSMLALGFNVLDLDKPKLAFFISLGGFIWNS